jgi:hypothetical protein
MARGIGEMGRGGGAAVLTTTDTVLPGMLPLDPPNVMYMVGPS